jgi:hypothetical protein
MSLWKVISGLIGDGVARALRIDASTHAMEVIEYEHHEIHGGSSFHCHYENLTTNIGEMTAIAFNCPNTTKWVHVTMSASVTSITRLSIVEAPSIDVDKGTQLTIYNRNRNSATASTVLSIEDTPVANKATSYNEAQAADANITTTVTLDSAVIGAVGATPAQAGVGGTMRGTQEWVLDQGVQYALLAESLSDDDNYVTLGVNYYEHTDKN